LALPSHHKQIGYTTAALAKKKKEFLHVKVHNWSVTFEGGVKGKIEGGKREKKEKKMGHEDMIKGRDDKYGRWWSP